MSKILIDAGKLRAIVERELAEMAEMNGVCTESIVGIGEIDGYQIAIKVMPSDGDEAFVELTEQHRCIEKFVPVEPPKPAKVTPDGLTWKILRLGRKTGLVEVRMPDNSKVEVRTIGFMVVSAANYTFFGSAPRTALAKFDQHSRLGNGTDRVYATYEIRPAKPKAAAKR